MRDDTKNGKVNLGGSAARAYHGMTSKQAMKPGWKTKAYINAAAEITNQTGRKQGFKNMSAGETTSGKKVPKTRPGESVSIAQSLVDILLNG